MHFKRAVKEVTGLSGPNRARVVAVVQEGLGSVRAVKAFGRQDLEAPTSRQRVTPQSRPLSRPGKSSRCLSPMVSIVVAICTAIVLWKERRSSLPEP